MKALLIALFLLLAAESHATEAVVAGVPITIRLNKTQYANIPDSFLSEVPLGHVVWLMAHNEEARKLLSNGIADIVTLNPGNVLAGGGATQKYSLAGFENYGFTDADLKKAGFAYGNSTPVFIRSYCSVIKTDWSAAKAREYCGLTPKDLNRVKDLLNNNIYQRSSNSGGSAGSSSSGETAVR